MGGRITNITTCEVNSRWVTVRKIRNISIHRIKVPVAEIRVARNPTERSSRVPLSPCIIGLARATKMRTYDVLCTFNRLEVHRANGACSPPDLIHYYNHGPNLTGSHPISYSRCAMLAGAMCKTFQFPWSRSRRNKRKRKRERDAFWIDVATPRPRASRRRHRGSLPGYAANPSRKALHT